MSGILETWGAFLLVTSAYLALLGLVAWVLMRLARLQGRATCALLGVVLAVPLLTPLQWVIPRPSLDWSAPRTEASLAARSDPAEGGPGLDAASGVSLPEESEDHRLAPDRTTASFAAVQEPPSTRSSMSWGALALILWAAGFLVLLAREMSGLRRLRRILAAAQPVRDAQLLALVQQAAARLGLRRAPRVLVAQGARVPFALAGFPGTIVLPEQFRRRASQPELRFVLLHELAHLRRGDCWWVCCTMPLRAVYFFHPVVLWALGRVREEQEILCDEEVVGADGHRSAYADYLSRVLREGPQPELPMVLGFLTRATSAYRRISRLIAPRSERASARESARAGARSGSSVGLALVLGVLLFAPGLSAGSRDPVRVGPAPDALDVEEPPADAIERGLDWLVAQQQEDGSWRAPIGYKLNVSYRVLAADAAHPGVTALAGLALLTNGSKPGVGPRGQAVSRAADFLLTLVDESGFVSHEGSRMYSHGYATLFLAEAARAGHAGAGDELQAVVDLALRCQNDDGSWSYYPSGEHSVRYPSGDGDKKLDLTPRGDASVSACVLSALQAAAQAGARVPKATRAAAIAYLESCEVKGPAIEDESTLEFPPSLVGAFRYQSTPSARATFGVTAAALAALSASQDDGPDRSPSVRILLRDMETVSDDGRRGHYFFYYGHLNASQALARVGGTAWGTYRERIRDELLAMQEPSAAWPGGEGPGPSFATAAALIVLARTAD